MDRAKVNNAFYEELGELWHEGSSHPVALLRAENALRNPWITTVLHQKQIKGKILDIGCGGGLLTNHLAREGHQVSGIDLSPASLETARKKDATRSVDYQVSSAESLPFENASFDAVCAMDLLEHVEDPARVIAEAGRVLKPGGLFFFHTFNRTWLSWLMVIKGVEWCVRSTPPNMHLYKFFITPEETSQMCAKSGLKVEKILGVIPDMKRKAFWKMLYTRQVEPDFRFVFTSSLKTGYSGYAIRD